MHPCVGVHWRISLRSSSLLLQQCPTCLVRLGWFLRWEVSSNTAATLWGVASRIRSKQHVAFLCSFHLAFFPCALSASMWYIHRVVSTQPQLGRNTILFYQRSDFHMIDNLLITVHAFAWNMLTSLSVDEILLPRYVNLSTNFSGLLLIMEMTPRLKHIYCFICIQ